jgi:hypothetical protein
VTGVKGFPAPESHTVLRSRGWIMVRISRVVCALLLAGVAAVAGAETVYKWVDTAGQIHYTDLPPRQAGAKVLGVYQKEAGTIQEDESDDYTDESDPGAPPEIDSESPSTPEPPVSQEAMAAAQADAEKAKVEQCKAAQDRYQRYIDSRRLFRETPDGKRVYLTDKELTEARARAKQSVDDYCR